MDGQTSTPIQNDISQATSAMTPGTGDASMEQRPAAQVPTPAQPTAMPQAPQQQPQAQSPAAPPSPADMHAGIFKHTLGLLAGGMNRPQLDASGNPVTDPTTGQVRMQQASAKQLGAGILAGAIASMVAGMAAPTQYKQFGEGMAARQVPDYGASIAAGANAAQPFTQEGSQKKAQAEADDAKNRAYAIFDHNLKFRSMALAADKADREAQQDVVDAYGTQMTAMNAQYESGKVTDEQGNQIDLWKMQNIPGTQVQKLMTDKTLGITKDMIIPVGVVEVPNEDGQGSHPETMFSVYNPKAVLHMSDDIRKDPAFSKLYGVANGTTLPVRVIASMSMNKGNETLASSGVDNWIKGFNGSIPKGSDISPIKDFDLQDAASSDKTGQIKKLYPYINKYRQDDLVAFFDDMKKDPNIAKDPSLQAGSALLQEAMGITSDDLSKMAEAKLDAKKTKEAVDRAQAEAAAKRNTPEGQADLLHKKLENLTLEQSLAQTAAEGKGIEIPKSFVANPRSAELQEPALTADLVSKGVKIPSNFAALYAIGHNSADLATLPTTPRKGVPQMPRDQALSFIRTYINPQYNEGEFSAAKKLAAEFASTRVGTAGGTMQAAGVASQHLVMLKQASDAMKNGNLQFLNEIGAKYGVATGSKPAIVFAAIAQKVNTEVEKVVSGSAPMEAQLKEGKANLERFESPEQVDGVIRGYVGLMNGRVGELDDRHVQYFGKHVHVSDNTRNVFHQYGFSTPDQPEGATSTFVSKQDGKTYWSDGKNNLGLVETGNTQH